MTATVQEIIFSVHFEDDLWCVFNEDGVLMDTHEDLSDAQESAWTLQTEARAEARREAIETEAAELRERITDRLDTLTLTQLRALVRRLP